MNWLAASFRVGRLFGIEIRIHILFVIWIVYRLVVEAGASGGVAHTALFLVMLFGIVLLHELGHCFGARSVGGDAHHIMMWPLGGLAYAHAPMRPWPQFVTVAAGPFVNVVFCLLSGLGLFFALGMMYLPGINPLLPGMIAVRDVPVYAPLLGDAWMLVLFTFYHVNLFLLAFNLLPIYPLDGGQIFHAILWPFIGLQRATLLACQVGLVGCVVLGLFSLTEGGGILLFIAIFGGITCWQRYQAARHGYLVEDPGFTVYNPPPRGGGFWSRLFKTRGRRSGPPAPGPVESPTADADDWRARQDERQREEAELDRLLKKVSERGIQSLSYVERQRLERITRQRKQREQEVRSGGPR